MSSPFGFAQVPDFSGHNQEGLLRDQQERLAAFAEFREHLDQAVGRATSEDERISVCFSEARGVHDLHLDPRAMKQTSHELASTIEQLVNEARADLRQQTTDGMREAFGGFPDPSALLQDSGRLDAHLEDVTRAAKEAGQDITTMVERLRTALPDQDPSGDRASSAESPDRER